MRPRLLWIIVIPVFVLIAFGLGVGAQVLHVWYQRGALPEHSEAVGKALRHVKSLGPVRTEEEERIEMQRHEVPPPPFRPKTHFAKC